MTISVEPPEYLDPDSLEAEVLAAGKRDLAAVGRPRIVGVGTAVTATSYSQQEVLDAFGITDPRIHSVFLNSAIERRHLTLPAPDSEGVRASEPQGDLLDKHKTLAVQMGTEALRACLKRAGAELSDLRHLCCVTSTGFLTPGLSALLIRELGIDRHCSRSDIVGMGCNAGLNALNVVAGWSAANPGELAVVLCVEACSAAYAMDATMRTAVVNSLFGDGAGAIALMTGSGAGEPALPELPVVPGIADLPATAAPGVSGVPAMAVPEIAGVPATAAPEGPSILKFASCIIPEAVDAMRYEWDRAQDRFSFFLDPQIPYVVGAHAEIVVDRLLSGTGLRRSDIGHWLVHSGGKKVIDAVVVNLGLTRHDVRHTTGVLRDYGNVSSGSFLFSYERLLDEGAVRPGDYGVLMTMGPGSTLETALVQW
ncbi:3,5-dihydroxyphenylacetyl-CoA synthase DpgA [Streptomyces sp. H27-D2]|uniref:3,5-dihydroxyphenylacetyl-CoA synthase DpgA n=1 Tax=Streptomyces sp. H27-D2 TaxID=3046304 RepID=UPI002DB62D96|nr:3,5-dihydroxyphenylacetyl-CoA synthase DpgA [Streptomyces sp. H27-D2]MEC4016318.1 3,5-dihydroxyphenylacetyl-CoA synthase DpgA [Streptomyces sp. H27-D2]